MGKAAPLLAEILLVNHNGEIMEGSITTPYFLREGEWITPSAKCGGNLGNYAKICIGAGYLQGKHCNERERAGGRKSGAEQ